MGEAKGEMAEVEGSAGKMGALGKTALLGLAAGAGAIAVESIKMASGFQSTMELIATQAHAGQQEVDAMSKAVLALAPTVGIGPEKLAEGLYHVESTGLRGQAAMDVLKASAQEAALGMADFDSVTYAMSGVMSIAMNDVKDAADGVAYLNTIVGTGDMRMQDLANAIGTGVLPVFKTAGLGMRDFGSALSVMTDNSMPAEVAANHLKTAVQLLQNQSGPAEKALASIGIKSGQLANDLRKPDGFLVAIEDVKDHLEKSGKTAAEQGQIISKAFGGAKSAGTIEEFVGELDKLKGKYGAMGDVAQRAKQQQDDWKNAQQTFSQKMKEVGAQFQVWAIQIGQVLLPILSKMADWFMSSVSWLGNHKDVLIAIGSVAVPLLAMGLWALVTATWAWTAALLANPLTWIVLLIAAVVFGIVELILHFKQVMDFLAPFGHWVKAEVIDPIIRAWNALMDFLRPLGQWIQTNVNSKIIEAWRTVSDWTRQKFNEIKAIIQPILDWIAAHWTQISAVITAVLHTLATEWQVVWGVISGVVEAAWGVIVATFKFAWDIIVTIFKTAWDIISGIVDGIISVIKGIIEFVEGVFTGNWKKAWQGILDVLKGIWDAVGGVLKGAWDFITGIFSGAGKWLWNAGSAIINGLLDGLKSAWNSVKSFVSGIGSWISANKGPLDYDRRLLIPHGNAIMDGLHEGLSAGAQRVQSYLDAFTVGISNTALSGSVSVSGSALGSGALGSGTTVINNITVQGSVIAEQDLQQTIQTWTLRYAARNPTNGLALGLATGGR